MCSVLIPIKIYCKGSAYNYIFLFPIANPNRDINLKSLVEYIALY